MSMMCLLFLVMGGMSLKAMEAPDRSPNMALSLKKVKNGKQPRLKEQSDEFNEVYTKINFVNDKGTCPLCSRIYAFSYMKIHIKEELGIKDHYCTYKGCGESFTNSGSKIRHEDDHANIEMALQNGQGLTMKQKLLYNNYYAHRSPRSDVGPVKKIVKAPTTLVSNYTRTRGQARKEDEVITQSLLEYNAAQQEDDVVKALMSLRSATP